jgi:hypothetical protein
MANPTPTAFVHPTFRNLRPADDPKPQVDTATRIRDEWMTDPQIDRVTTQLPKRGGAAVIVGWQKNGDGSQTPVAQGFILPDGEIKFSL